MDQKLILLWAFVMVLLLLTTFHRKEDYEEMKNSGKEAGKVAHDAMYNSVYQAHSQACVVLKKYKNDIIGMTIKNLSKTPSEPLTDKGLAWADNEVKNFKKRLLSELSKIEEMVGIDYEEIENLMNNYIDIIAKKLMNGEKPSEKFLNAQYDDFVASFCEDIDTNNKLLPVIDDEIKNIYN